MMIKNIKKGLFGVVALLLLGVMLVSGWLFLRGLNTYHSEEALKKEMMAYKPAETELESASHTGLAGAKTVNPDVLGWISIPGTGVDYAFVHSKDNNDYLRRDLHGKYALAGTIFLDYGNSPDFTDPQIILYGHNMQNGGMFGDLEKYRDGKFMQNHQQGEIFLENGRIPFTVFACIEVAPDDEQVYGNITDSSSVQQNLVNWKKHSVQYIETEWQENDRLLMLSTCLGESGKNRLVVLAKIEG